MRSIVTPDDLKKGEPIPPGWYPAEITKVNFEITKGSDDKPSDGSENAIFFFKLLDGDKKGVELRRYFNEKAMGFGKNLWVLLFPGKFDVKKGGELTTEMLASTVGKQMMVYIKKNKQGFDNVEDWRPITA